MAEKGPKKSTQGLRYASAMAGEFFVLHALHRARLNASLTLGNAKGVDIFVSLTNGRAIKVEVKTISDPGSYFLGSQGPTLDTAKFWCLVCFDSKFETPEVTPRVWVVPNVCLRLGCFLSHDKGGYGTTVSKLKAQGGAFLHAWHLISDPLVSSPRSTAAIHRASESTDASSFYDGAYKDNWILHGIHAVELLGPRKRGQIEESEDGIERLDADDLACYITTLVRGERFVEGTLKDAKARGLLSRIVRRAETLLTPAPSHRES